MKHNYYIVYRVGNWSPVTYYTMLSMDFRIDSVVNFDKVRQRLEKMHNTTAIIILNWIELK